MAELNVTMPRPDPIARSKNVVDDLEDAISPPESLPAPIAPTDPIDGEGDKHGGLLPPFGIDYLYAERQLERYIDDSELHRERLYAKQHASLLVQYLHVL
jgi:hypothetical protein